MSKSLPAIVDGAVVAMYYTLKDSAGEVLDTNRNGGEVLAYIHGASNIGGVALQPMEARVCRAASA